MTNCFQTKQTYIKQIRFLRNSVLKRILKRQHSHQSNIYSPKVDFTLNPIHGSEPTNNDKIVKLVLNEWEQN